MDYLTPFADSFHEFTLQLRLYGPRLLGAFVLLLGGWVLAKLLRKGAIKGLNALRVDMMAEKSGVEDFLLRGGVRYTAVTILANIVYWFVMFTVTLAVLNSLGLQAAAQLFNEIILYIPNVFVALLVLIFGSLFAKVFQGLASAYLNNVGITGAEVISHIAQYAILVFVVLVALEQLKVGGQVLLSAFQIAFGALCLALALAFGLGGRDVAARILERLWKRSDQ